jgi:hypothetical protein
MIETPLTSGGGAAVHVRRIQLVAPHFTPVPPTAFNDNVAPGQRVDFPIGYGVARCDVAPDAGQVTVVVDVDAPGGGPETVRLAVPRPAEILDRLYRVECAQRHLEAAFSVEWGSTWTRAPAEPGGAQRLRGDLLLRLRAGSRPVTVTNVQGSVLFAIDSVPADRRPLARMDAAAPEATVPIELSVRLCFKHGLIEAKKVFVFTLYARLGDAHETYRTIEPPQAVQKQLLGLLATCPPNA